MSLKLYFLDRFGVIKRTKKIERKRNEMWKHFQNFQKLEGSGDLQRFLELEEEVCSAAFAQNKANIKALKYKGSKEQLKVAEYEKLSSKGKLAPYYEVVNSDDFKRFKELDSSYLIKEFLLSKEYVEKEYEADKKKFDSNQSSADLNWEESKPYQKYRLYEETLNTNDVQFWLSYIKSKAYGIYKENVNATGRVHLEELKREIETESFKQQQAFLENPNRWETTPEYAREKEYEALCADERFVGYVKHKDNADFQFFMQYNKVLLNDEFKGNALKEDVWQHMSSYMAKYTGLAFSQEADLQGYTPGDNVKINHEILQLSTSQEETKSFIWKAQFGLIPYTFPYSSGALSWKQPITAKEGVVEVKVKYSPTKRIADVIYLANADGRFRLNILEMGARTQVGYQKGNEKQGTSVSGLRKGKYYIFKIEWTENKVIWKLNNRTMQEVALEVPQELSLNMRSIVVDKKPKASHKLQVDWVSVFAK